MFALLATGRQLYGDFLVDLLAHVLYPSPSHPPQEKMVGVEQTGGSSSSSDYSIRVSLPTGSPTAEDGLSPTATLATLSVWLTQVCGMSVEVLLLLTTFLLLLVSALHLPLPTEICDRKKIQMFEFALRLANEMLGDIFEFLGGAYLRNRLTRFLCAIPYCLPLRPPRWCHVRNENIAGVSCRLYVPQGARRKSTAIIVFIHGGGWCIMRPSYYDGPMYSLMARMGCAIVSIDYQLSPEVRFPTAIEECERVVKELRKEAGKYGLGDGERMALMGDSAGGNLCAVLCQRALREGRNFVKCQVLLYPVIHCLDMLSPSYEYYYNSYKGTALLNPKLLVRWLLMYLGIEPSDENIKAMMKNQHLSSVIRENGEVRDVLDHSLLPKSMRERYKENEPAKDVSKKETDGIASYEKPQLPPPHHLSTKISSLLTNPDLCPILGKNLEGLPPAMICTAGIDILRDEGILYAKRLKSFGVPVEWMHYESAFHGIIHMPASKQRKQILDDVATYLRRNL